MIDIQRRTFVTAACAALVATPSFLRAAPAAGELRDDMVILRRALELHPGLLRYRTRREIDRDLQQLEREYVAAPTQERQFLLLAEFLAKVRCGHTQCNPYNQSDAVVSSLFERRTRVPFEFAWIEGRMIVLADRSGSGWLEPGTEITAINGETTRHLLHRLVAYARADGGNDGKRVAQMEMRNTDRFETFDIFQGLLQPPCDGRFAMHYRTPRGRTGSSDFAALSVAERAATRHTIVADGATEPFWTWTVEDGIATLTMPSWVMYNSSWDWKPWLTERLDSLAGARGLIIDLRENEGGNECGNVILARLAEKDLGFEGYRQLVRYRRTPSDLDPFLDTWDKSFRTIGEGAQDLGNGFYELGKEATDIIPATGPRLTLPVAALVGPTCSSATFSFARRAQESGLARLFGEQTGGNLRGINGGAYFFVRLPGSGLEFDIPLIANFSVSPQPDRGVIPDEMVRPNISDIALGDDPCLKAAQSWIRST
jgi:hypothetical protein